MKHLIALVSGFAISFMLPSLAAADSPHGVPPPPPPAPTALQVSVSGHGDVQVVGNNVHLETHEDGSGDDHETESMDMTDMHMDGDHGSTTVHSESESHGGKGQTHVSVQGWGDDGHDIDIERNATTSDDATASVDIKHPEKVKTKGDLEEFVQGVIGKDDDIDDAHLSASSTDVDVHVHGKLFGFIPMALPAQINADERGQISVHLPWWRWLFTTDAGDIQAQLTASTTASSTQTLSGRANFFVVLMHILQSRSDVSLHATTTVTTATTASTSTATTTQ